MPAVLSKTVLLPSLARTAAASSSEQANGSHVGGHFFFDVTAHGGGNLVCKVEGQDLASGKWYPIIEGTAVTEIGPQVLKVVPNGERVSGASAADFLPAVWRTTVTPSSGASCTYSVGANLFG